MPSLMHSTANSLISMPALGNKSASSPAIAYACAFLVIIEYETVSLLLPSVSDLRATDKPVSSHSFLS